MIFTYPYRPGSFKSIFSVLPDEISVKSAYVFDTAYVSSNILSIPTIILKFFRNEVSAFKLTILYPSMACSPLSES